MSHAYGVRQGRTGRGVSGALYLQSAIAETNPAPGFAMCRLTLVSSDDETVLRNGNL